MSREDIDTNRAVRSVLVRHWLNLGLLTVRTFSGRTTLRGDLVRMDGFKEPLTSAIVEAILGEIRRLPSVRHLNVQVENWVQSGGRWLPRDTDPGSGVERTVYRDASQDVVGGIMPSDSEKESGGA